MAFPFVFSICREHSISDNHSSQFPTLQIPVEHPLFISDIGPGFRTMGAVLSLTRLPLLHTAARSLGFLPGYMLGGSSQNPSWAC